jgi:zinc transporter ZupT
MTNVIDAAGGRAEFWLGLLLTALGGALVYVAGLVIVPAILHAHGA